MSVVCLCLWIPSFLHAADGTVWHLVATMLMSVVNALLLMYLVYEAGITRTRQSLPVFCYLLLTAASPALHTCWEGQLAVLVLAAVCLMLLNTYRSENAVQESFISTLLICAAVLVLPDMLFMLPVLWIGFAVQRAFNLRVALASVVAVCIFALYLWLSVMLFPDAFGIVSLHDAFCRSWIGLQIPMLSAVSVLLLEVWGVLFAVWAMIGFSRETNRAQSLVLLLLLILLVSMPMLLFPPLLFSSLQPVAYFATAALAAYCFSTRQSVAAGVIFLLFILLNIINPVLTIVESYLTQ